MRKKQFSEMLTQIKELTPKQLNALIGAADQAKNVVNKLADIISLVRFQLGQTTELNTFSVDVARRFQQWTFEKQRGPLKFSSEQMVWLHMLRDHIAASMSVTTDHLDLSPFDSKGGLGRFYELFGDAYESVLEEMNYTLLAA
jgi:type I restriction enzyme R subunit